MRLREIKRYNNNNLLFISLINDGEINFEDLDEFCDELKGTICYWIREVNNLKSSITYYR